LDFEKEFNDRPGGMGAEKTDADRGMLTGDREQLTADS